jgi:uncharacterized membrane protein YsdA (DUF1294 family)/cold shock CspA family protein
MGRELGTLIRWDNDKGYGFIRPKVGYKDVFFHIGSLPHYQRRPKIGDTLTFEIEVDDHGRSYATSSKIKGVAWSLFTLVWGCLLLLFLAYLYLAIEKLMPFHPAALYVGMSLLTIWAYGRDKRAAQLGLWRTREFTLHTMEALGGWPGALFAQIFYRHKLKKLSYQIVLGCIILVHGVLWFQLFTDQTKYPYRETVNAAIRGAFQTIEGTVSGLLANSNRATISKSELMQTRNEQKSGASFSHRSLVAPLQGTRTVSGVVKEIRPGEGIVVTLDGKKEGMVRKSTLVANFPSLFKKGEQLQVAVQSISFTGKTGHIELILVED